MSRQQRQRFFRVGVQFSQMMFPHGIRVFVMHGGFFQSTQLMVRKSSTHIHFGNLQCMFTKTFDPHVSGTFESHSGVVGISVQTVQQTKIVMAVGRVFEKCKKKKGFWSLKKKKGGN